ncbi:hypothetical protein MCOR25_004133 [Pyricularia grisea]|uniref:Uncharacterized protein n=1 Tax=Pyricularia grisea TaxID=148305 RepID=A0A6P8B1G2_PYRGI|nr:uncharacterized protein PgNI_07399 [Pyricularia grisea]KAI6370590.1 hypothetical protein MCOR25_004133 [Pyricularia grisea]TLD08669.1 hypothetical protein PgNI_07399 [Pyricularia grisea]
MQFSSVFLIAFAAVAVSAGELRMVRRAAAEKPAKVLAGNPTISITGTGADDVAAKPDACGTVTPTGQNPQTVCIKKVTATGFDATVKDTVTKTVEKCSVEGKEGACGTAGAGAKLSNLADGN